MFGSRGDLQVNSLFLFSLNLDKQGVEEHQLKIDKAKRFVFFISMESNILSDFSWFIGRRLGNIFHCATL